MDVKINELRKYGIKPEDTMDIVLYMLKSNGSRSHVIGAISECKFASNITKLFDPTLNPLDKVPDNDYSKRYDFNLTVDINGKQQTISFEVKTAKPNKTFDLNFRDGREREHCGHVIRSHLRSVEESFDFAAINMVNVTGCWDDILIVPFHTLPMLSNMRSNKIPKEIQEDMVNSKKYIASTIHLDKIQTYTISDLPRLLLKS